jgi:uncharacterized SAM-binding protein YcdF (DUF218 family)
MFGKIVRGFLQAVGFLTVLGLLAGGLAVVSLGGWLQYEDQLRNADYIVPLAGDADRLVYAAQLYKQGLAPKLLIDNDLVIGPSRSQKLRTELGYPWIDPRELRTRLLKFLNVPDDAIATFGEDYISTSDEADALKKFLGDHAATVIVVTSPYHTRRAKMIFERTIPRSHFVVVSTPEGRLHEPWWSDQQSANQTILEMAKIFYFWLGGAFRSAR